MEWFRADQIRKQDKDFMKEEEKTLNIWYIHRVWSYKEKIFDKKRNKKTDRMMRNILEHASLEWREQRSTCARILDSKNQDRMKRRRPGVVHTN